MFWENGKKKLIVPLILNGVVSKLLSSSIIELNHGIFPRQTELKSAQRLILIILITFDDTIQT